ncbi:MAG: protein kinase domain-containing protein, partial [Methanobacterium sp.]
YIEGHTLKEEVQKRGQIPEAEVINWAIQLCDILSFLHKRNPPIIFRDLKPDNIMLTPDGQIKLIDFGIARHFQKGNTADTTAYGSTGFAPPEQYGENQTDPRSDIYALGATLHYLLTGIDPSKNPFNFEPPSTKTSVSNKMEKAIMKALELKAVNRPQSIDEFKLLISQYTINRTVRQESHAKATGPLVSEPTGSKLNEAATMPLKMVETKGTKLLTSENDKPLNAAIPAAKMNAAKDKPPITKDSVKLPSTPTGEVTNQKVKRENWIALTTILAIILIIGGVFWSNRTQNELLSSNNEITTNNQSSSETQNNSAEEPINSDSVNSNDQNDAERSNTEPDVTNNVDQNSKEVVQNTSGNAGETSVGFVDASLIPSEDWFYEGLAHVILPNQSHVYINEQGQIMIGPFWAVHAGDFSEGLAVVKDTNGKWYYINKQGKTAVTVKVDCVYSNDFENGLARVDYHTGVDGPFAHGYIDKTGNWAK